MPRPLYNLHGKRVWVAGHRGMVGGALLRRLAREECVILTAPRSLDLRRQEVTEAWLRSERPQALFLAAARVGGIAANHASPGCFLYDNLMIAANVMEAARRQGVEKLLFLGSSCIYPREAPQPIPEEALLSGPLEETNQWYAIAKIAGLKLAQAYRRQHGCDYVTLQPSNLYGPGDNFDPQTGHAPAALLRRCHEAKQAGASRLTVWGSGRPRREFLQVDDLADACVFVMRHYSDEAPLNAGSGEEVTIAELAGLIARTVGFEGQLIFDPSRPDGAPRKLLDSSRLQGLGWRARVPLQRGLADTYRAFLAEQNEPIRRSSSRNRPPALDPAPS
jgi:GDP-L-fucose synthase